MSNDDLVAILALPVQERLHLVEAIWESLAAARYEVPLSSAHREAVDEALAEHQRNPNDVLSFDEVLSALRMPR